MSSARGRCFELSLRATFSNSRLQLHLHALHAEMRGVFGVLAGEDMPVEDVVIALDIGQLPIHMLGVNWLDLRP